MKVVLINGTVVGSKTKVLLHEVESQLKQFSAIKEIEHINLEDYQLEFADGRIKEQYSDETQSVINRIENADGYIVATPIFQGSIPGALKNLFDLISPKAMRYKPVSILANGGTIQHHLVIENQLKPILDYFRSLITPNYVYTHPSHFSHDNELIDEDVRGRVYELARVFSHYITMSQLIIEEDHLNY
ncbi:NADPH-dependent FMN reductase [Alkalibacillus haloalkaliphilus]|uniref:FMN reductase n=1 Tax=Alkalibacillus haloalkaliphilus TaxID=94136 RepID=A0A511W4W1_9BACI|nr:NADPH-dependent FMN reductase [Alkalibacillus haloalkaliphilus]GEN46115.1 FMN reductase [Alkalibacillus haloalkaliphilus]